MRGLRWYGSGRGRVGPIRATRLCAAQESTVKADSAGRWQGGWKWVSQASHGSVETKHCGDNCAGLALPGTRAGDGSCRALKLSDNLKGDAMGLFDLKDCVRVQRKGRARDL